MGFTSKSPHQVITGKIGQKSSHVSGRGTGINSHFEIYLEHSVVYNRVLHLRETTLPELYLTKQKTDNPSLPVSQKGRGKKKKKAKKYFGRSQPRNSVPLNKT